MRSASGSGFARDVGARPGTEPSSSDISEPSMHTSPACTRSIA